MKKKIIIISTVLVVLGVVIAAALLCFKLVDRIMYGSFYDAAEEEFYIPDLMDGFVPQGFEYMESEKVFLACGYMSNGDASRVYVISEDGEEYYYTELTETDISKAYTGHTGGIAYYGNYVYITGSDGIDVFDLDVILDKESETAPKLATIDTSAYGVDPAFCFVYDGALFTGEFYLEGKYDTPQEHHIDIEGRDNNKAIMLSFPLHASYSYNVGDAPNAVYSIPDKVQGICMIGDGKIALSTSYGMSASYLYVHDFEKVTESTYSSGSVGVDGSVPLYVIDSTTLLDTLEAAPMAEEIVYLDGKLWIMNESASNKYIFGKFTTGNYLFSVEYPFPVD